MTPQRKKLGRPYGRKTFREPPGVKYARQYLELWAVNGLRPTAAARAVAAEWNISESDVFHSYTRHRGRLLPDLDKALRANYVWFGRWLIRYHPDVADEFARLFVSEFHRGLEETACKIESLGNTAGAQAVRVFDPSSLTEGDDWLALIGKLYLVYLKPKRNKPIR